MAVRLSTLAEIKVLSLSTLLYANTQSQNVDLSSINFTDIEAKLTELRDAFKNNDAALKAGASDLFTTVGLARQLRIDEDYGTQNIYGIGAPTRPRIVPNNYSVNVTADRLQLDTRNLAHYMTTPEYWYSHDVQRNIGINDYLLYTYLFVKSKEDPQGKSYDIYALMPRNSSATYSSGDVMVVNNVSLTGFKYSYESAVFDSLEFLADSFTSSGGGGGGGIQRLTDQ